MDKGNLDIVKLIVEANASIDAVNYERRTALHLAASLRKEEGLKLEMCSYLISKGASKRIKDKNKDLPRSLVPPQQTRVRQANKPVLPERV